MVTADTIGYIPNILASKPKSAVSHSIAAPPTDTPSEVKLFYQTSPESDLFCQFCNKNYKKWGTLKTHLKKMHGRELVLTCEKCNTTFDDGKAYGLHLGRKTDCSKLKKYG